LIQKLLLPICDKLAFQTKDKIQDINIYYELDEDVIQSEIFKEGTFLDFLKSEISRLKKSSIDVKLKIMEYEELYNLLKKYGAKHTSEL
jgi:hypothetical protein